MKDSLGGDLGSISTMSGLSQLGANSSYYTNDMSSAIDPEMVGLTSGNMQGLRDNRTANQIVAAKAAANYGQQKKKYIMKFIKNI